MWARWAYSLALIAALIGAVSAPAGADGLRRVLEQTKDAAGGASLDKLKALRFAFKLSQAGLEGHGTTLTDFTTGRTVTRYTLGPLRGATGFDGRVTWFEDTAGIVTVPLGGEQPAQAISARYRNTLGQWYPARAPPAFLSLRMQLFRQRVKEVVEVTPQHGVRFEMWFDAQTKLLDRVIEEGASETRTLIYEDYRAHNGVMIPRRLRLSNAAASLGAVRQITKVEFNPALTGREFAVPRQPKPDYSFQGRAPVVSLPFRLANNHIYIEVLLHTRKFQFLIDTGASNVMSPETARTLRLRPVGVAAMRGAGDLPVEAAFTRVRSMTLSNLRFDDQLFAVVDLKPLAAAEGERLDGILGYEIFKRFIVRIDYAARVLTLTEPQAWSPQGAGIPLAFTFNGTVPEVQGEIEGVRASFEIDTGARTALSLNSPFVLRHGLRGRMRPQLNTVTGWGLGGATRGTIARAKRVKLASVPALMFEDIITDLSSQSEGLMAHAVPSGSIGGGLLKRYNVTFDYGRQRVFFAQHAMTRARENFDRAGLWINRHQDGFLVIDVIERSPAAVAGIKPGDMITEVDGKRAQGVSLDALRNRLREDRPGTLVRFKLSSGLRTREVLVTLRDLI